MIAAAAPPPREIRLGAGGRMLSLDFGPSGSCALSAEFLRVHSPSAEVQGHGPDERRLVSGKRHVAIAAIEPVGRYAVRLRFDDGHNTGLFTWEALLEFGRRQDALWAEYLDALQAAGLRREA